MKIAYVLAEYPSLTETFIAREIAALRRYGFEIDVWALKAGAGARAIPVGSGARLRAKLCGADQRHWFNIGANWVRREHESLKNVQRIHAGWASFPAEIAQGAAQVLGVPWSFFGHARDLWVEGENLGGKLRAAQFAASCTRPGVEFLQAAAPEAAPKVLYAPHGLELSQHHFHGYRALHEPIRILAVGRLVEKKGFAVLLAALGVLRDTGHSFSTTLIGEGPLRGALQRQIPPGLEVHLPGKASGAGVGEAMREADLLVVPSLEANDGDRDGLPNVLLEAAACGLPIVSTCAGAITDFLEEDCARLCAPGDPRALAHAIGAAVENYGESLRRSRVARSRVAQNFDIDDNIAVLVRAFEA